MKTSAFQNAKKQIDNIASVLSEDYPDNKRFTKAISLLKKPQKLITKKIKIKLDNGKTKSFIAFRSQHNDARGPYKGGIRFHPNVSEDEVKALSIWMSVKNAVVGIPYGGGKGGIIVDPKTLSLSELEKLCRAYSSAITPFIGQWRDVPAPDVNTGGREMAWMLDEYEKKIGYHSPGTFTGKPIELGGSLGREEATGLGGFFILQKYAKNNLDYSRHSESRLAGEESRKKRSFVAKASQDDTKRGKIKIAIQGFGNVGYWFAYFARENGSKVVAVSDSTSAIYDKKGFDIEKINNLKQKYGSFSNFPKSKSYKQLTNSQLLALDVDVLVPAALENAITAENAKDIKAKVILEMANGPTTPEAEEILLKKKIDILPDVLCNAGGVTVSYFEWVQNLHGYRWEKEKIYKDLKVIMDESFDSIYKIVKSKKTSYRKSAYLIAVKRIIDAMMARGRV